MLSHIANEDWSSNSNSPFSFLKQELKKIFIFRERGREEEREGEKHQCVVASQAPPTGDLATTQACALTRN